MVACSPKEIDLVFSTLRHTTILLELIRDRGVFEGRDVVSLGNPGIVRLQQLHGDTLLLWTHLNAPMKSSLLAKFLYRLLIIGCWLLEQFTLRLVPEAKSLRCNLVLLQL